MGKSLKFRFKTHKTNFTINYCLKCWQMTNHAYNEKTMEMECQKCKKVI